MGGMFSELNDLEQRRPTPPPLPATPGAARAPQPPTPSAEPLKRGTAQPRNSASPEPRIRASAEPHTHHQPAGVPPITSAEFDLARRPDKPHGFLWTEQELWALEDMKKDLERRHGRQTSMQELIRCALHMLVEDYRAHGRDSVALSRLTTKRP